MGFGGGYSTPDNSAYENELARQRQATAEAEGIASQKKAQEDAAFAASQNARKGSLLMSDDEKNKAPKTTKSILGGS